MSSRIPAASFREILGTYIGAGETLEFPLKSLRQLYHQGLKTRLATGRWAGGRGAGAVQEAVVGEALGRRTMLVDFVLNPLAPLLVKLLRNSSISSSKCSVS